SENNLSNPDPNQTVRWGDQTWNEMMIGYFDVAVPVGVVAPDRRPGAAIRQALNTPEARRQQGRLLLLRFDANKDGKLQKSEIPERSRALFDLFDKNKDGDVTLE